MDTQYITRNSPLYFRIIEKSLSFKPYSQIFSIYTKHTVKWSNYHWKFTKLRYCRPKLLFHQKPVQYDRFKTITMNCQQSRARVFKSSEAGKSRINNNSRSRALSTASRDVLSRDRLTVGGGVITRIAICANNLVNIPLMRFANVYRKGAISHYLWIEMIFSFC